MTIRRAKVFSLRKVNYGESDSIVTLLGRQEGKFSVLAKGARKSQKRFGAEFDLLNYSELVYYEGKNLSYPSQADLISSWDGLKSSQELIQSGLECAKLVNTLLKENQPVPRIYNLFHRTLNILDDKPAQGRIVELAFYLKFIQRLGVQPGLDECKSCGRSAPQIEKKLFSPRAGGLVCKDCGEREGKKVFEFSEGLYQSLQYLIRLPQEKVTRVKFETSMLDKAFLLLDSFVVYHWEIQGKFRRGGVGETLST